VVRPGVSAGSIGTKVSSTISAEAPASLMIAISSAAASRVLSGTTSAPAHGVA
jgi:hypothetical protein